MNALNGLGLPESIHFQPGQVTIECHDVEQLADQLILLASALRTDSEKVQLAVQGPEPRPASSQRARAYKARSA